MIKIMKLCHLQYSDLLGKAMDNLSITGHAFKSICKLFKKGFSSFLPSFHGEIYPYVS